MHENPYRPVDVEPKRHGPNLVIDDWLLILMTIALFAMSMAVASLIMLLMIDYALSQGMHSWAWLVPSIWGGGCVGLGGLLGRICTTARDC